MNNYFSQQELREIFVDNFAGGGGASQGIEVAIGRSVDIAVNHDPDAIAMHMVNHPDTKHYCEDVWQVNPYEACAGRPVALAWFSPDCKHFSRAKGGKPLEKKIRGLAWVSLRWAATVRPRVIMLENVPEIQTWGPLDKNGKPIKEKAGITFQSFIRQLKDLGYDVEYRVLKSCDYGAPTIRKRFYLIARCDGKPIIWPEPTYSDRNSLAVKLGSLKPYRTAAECIDWSIPTQSIFDRKKPLAENTLNRIAKGIEKFVLNNPEPFIVQVNHGGVGFRGQSLYDPLQTVTAKHGYGIVVPTIMANNTNNNGAALTSPLPTITTGNRNYMIAPTLIQYHSETFKNEVRGQRLEEPIMTVDTSNRYALAAAHIVTLRKNMNGQRMDEPLNTITASGTHHAEVLAFLTKYYGSGDNCQSLNEPLHTITAKDRFGLITLYGQDYVITDIHMRMLQPHELFAAMGFPASYIIDRDISGKKYPKSKQVARCGNAVTPPVATALVRSNLQEYCSKKLLEIA